jgi:hypothetical protein
LTKQLQCGRPTSEELMPRGRPITYKLLRVKRSGVLRKLNTSLAHMIAVHWIQGTNHPWTVLRARGIGFLLFPLCLARGILLFPLCLGWLLQGAWRLHDGFAAGIPHAGGTSSHRLKYCIHAATLPLTSVFRLHQHESKSLARMTHGTLLLYSAPTSWAAACGRPVHKFGMFSDAESATGRRACLSATARRQPRGPRPVPCCRCPYR